MREKVLDDLEFFYLRLWKIIVLWIALIEFRMYHRRKLPPVSNLSFLSKLLKRAAQARLEVFLDCSDLMPTMQWAYRRFYSTVTAVLKIYNDLLLAADKHSALRTLSAWPDCCLRHRRPWSGDAQTWASVWSSQCRFGLVQVISLWQNVSSHPLWQDIIYCSRYMFRASRFCSRAA